ncbi:MAG TPA: sugar phosphate isomerase/epimerase family protein [Pirellulales bacterium]|jgi:sugar phosphate isomerase/epimerase|nr:sugar phosphate isomerase/epimerase family protein [Pirellulales bacterium]
MKFAICNETFQDWPFDRAFAFARAYGYTGLEMAPFTIDTDVRRISPSKRAEVRRQAEAADLQIIGLHWLLAKTEGFYLTSPDADVRRRTAAYLGDLAHLCRDLGGSIMVLGSPLQRILLPGVSEVEGMRYAADVLTQAMPGCEATDVTIALEPLSTDWGRFLNTAAEGVELMEMVGSPHCRLHLDCIAMSTEPTPIPELLKRHRREMVHLHVNDPNKQGPGMGKLDFAPILRTLGEIDYRGWVSVEVFDYTPGPERLARESIENLRAAAKAAG